MDRRSFLSTSAAAVAAPIGLVLGEREAAAIEEDCSWMPTDCDADCDWVENVLVRGEWPVTFTGSTISEFGAWARGETDREYDRASEHLAELLNNARGRIGRTACKIDPGLMTDSYQWAKWMASHRRMVHASSKSRGGAAEIIAVNGEYTNAVTQWWNSRSGRARGFLRRRRRRRSDGDHYGIMIGSQYTKIGAGVVQVRGGAWYCCARYA